MGKLRGYLAILGVLIAWGSSYSISRIAMEFMSPFALSMFRFVVGGLVMLVIARGLIINLKSFINALLNSALFVIFLNLAILYTTNPALAAVLAYTQPIFVLIISAIMGYEKVSRFQVLGVVVAFLGILISVGSMSFDLGSLIAIIGGFTWALGTIYYRKNLIQEDLVKLNASMSLFSSVVTLPILIADPPRSLTLSMLTWGIIVAIISQVIGFLLWFLSIRELGAVTASSMSLLVPVMAYVFAYFLLSKVPTIIELIGSTLTLFGVFLAQSRNLRISTKIIH